jgi:hypothetical protein
VTLDIEDLERGIIADSDDWLSRAGMVLFELDGYISPVA